MITTQETISTFALMVDKLRLMDEAELKLAYMNLFENDLTKKWEKLIGELNFQDMSDSDIEKAINQHRYQKKV